MWTQCKQQVYYMTKFISQWVFILNDVKMVSDWPWSVTDFAVFAIICKNPVRLLFAQGVWQGKASLFI